MGSGIFVSSFGYIYIPEEFSRERFNEINIVVRKWFGNSVSINYHSASGGNEPIVISVRNIWFVRNLMEDLGYEQYRMVVIPRYRPQAIKY